MAKEMGEGIHVKGDDFLMHHNQWAKGEASDASNSGKRREAIGSYAEKHGLENKAMSQIRAGLKIKNDGKRKDWLRTMQALLVVAEAEIFRNEELDLDDTAEEDRAEAAEEALSDEDDIDQDAEDFDAAADDALDGDDGVVTPIDFSQEAVG